MPTFDFACGACGHVFELTRPFGSKTAPVCPACKSKKTEKRIAPPTIQFRGAGFYRTDHAKPAQPPAQGSAAPAIAEKTPSKPESKPELKKDSKTAEK